MKRAILFVTFAAVCGAQTTVNGGRDYKGTLKASGSVSAVDFTGAGSTAPIKAGTGASRPTACTQGQVYFSTDAAAGQNLYFCTITGAPGQWTQMSGSAGGGGGGTAPYISPLTAGPDTTKTITGATHGFATTALLVMAYDNATPRNAISVGWTVNPSTYDVSIAFASAQSNYYVMINGGTGPAGPTGATGATGASGNGTGNVNPSGTIAANRIATFTDTTGTLIQDGAQHSLGSGYLSTTKTAGAGGVTANQLCKVDSTGNVVAATAGDASVLGVCMSTVSAAGQVEVATRGIVNCVADNATTIGNMAAVGTTTAGRCKDSGQANATGISVSTQVLGKILTAVSAGNAVSIQLYGPGHYGAAVQVLDGGTGQTTYTKGDLIAAAGGTTLNKLSVGTDGQTLTADAASTNGVKWAGSNRRTCVIDNDSHSGAALTGAQITGRCEIPFAAHIIEVGVWGGTGTGTQTYTGSGSVQLTRLRPNGGGTATILSAALGTPNSSADSNRACARATTSGTCINGLTSSSSVTLAGGATVALNAGDTVYVSSATADGVQTWYTVAIVYTED
jgi:hypothetical protein